MCQGLKARNSIVEGLQNGAACGLGATRSRAVVSSRSSSPAAAAADVVPDEPCSARLNFLKYEIEDPGIWDPLYQISAICRPTEYGIEASAYINIR